MNHALNILIAAAVLWAGVWCLWTMCVRNMQTRGPLPPHALADPCALSEPTRIGFSPAMRTVALVFLLPTVVVGVAFWAQRAGLSDRGPLSVTTLVHTGFALASAWFASVLLGVLPQRLGPILADADGIKVPRIGRIDEYRWESLTITAHRMAADVSACLARDGDRKALFFCDDRSIAALRAGLQGVAAKESS